MVVSKNNECYFEVLRVSSNFDYVPLQYRGNKTIKTIMRNESNQLLNMETVNFKTLTSSVKTSV